MAVRTAASREIRAGYTALDALPILPRVNWILNVDTVSRYIDRIDEDRLRGITIGPTTSTDTVSLSPAWRRRTGYTSANYVSLTSSPAAHQQLVRQWPNLNTIDDRLDDLLSSQEQLRVVS